MKRLALVLALCVCGCEQQSPDAEPAPLPTPTPAPAPKKPKRPCWPPTEIRPVWSDQDDEVYGAKEGGTIAPDGKTEIQIDLPGKLHRENISSRGQGCCVFRSLHHASLYQNVPALHDFPEWLRSKGLPGGGYPGNVTERIKMICRERGMPEPAYVQIESRDVELLKEVLLSGRMLCCTYSKSPTRRYGGGTIAHMVNVVHGDEHWVAVLDNNYIGVDHYEWMSWDEFSRIVNPRGYWAVALLSPGPPPVPVN